MSALEIVGGEGRLEENFEGKLVVLFGDGVRHLPQYHLPCHMQQLQS